MEWQPIETAPRDGTRVLAWRDTWGDPMFVRWFLNPRTDTRFWNDDEELDAYENEHEPPTHWLPLPELPRTLHEWEAPNADVTGLAPGKDEQ